MMIKSFELWVGECLSKGICVQKREVWVRVGLVGLDAQMNAMGWGYADSEI